jgi:S1-C subfamily serine protease
MDAPEDRSELASVIMGTVMHLVVQSPEGGGTATGFLVTGDGLVATNAHVVRNASSVEALMGPDRGSAQARVVMVDEDLDLALLAVVVPEDIPMTPLPLGSSIGLAPLTELIVVGNAKVLPGDPPRVVVARVARNHELDSHYFETDGAIEGGFSGGPVFDPLQGAAAGIVVAGRGDTVKMMIRIERLREMLGELDYRIEEE